MPENGPSEALAPARLIKLRKDDLDTILRLSEEDGDPVSVHVRRYVHEGLRAYLRREAD